MKKEILQNMASYFDHSIVKADATKKEIIQFCEEAKKYGFATVVIDTSYVELVRENLKGSNVKICSNSGYPLGANTTDVKVYETRRCAEMGVDELDTVMNIGYFMDGDYDYVIADLKAIVDEFKSHGEDKVVKVIIETAIIGNERIKQAVECAVAAGADFVKTSSGYGGGGAKLEDVIAMTKAADGRIQVKASGGIRTLEDAYKYIDAGAVRLGGTGGVRITEAANTELERNYSV